MCIRDRDFLAGVRKLESFGFNFSGKPFLKKLPTVSEKIKEFNRLISDPQIKMLLALRGGYGSIKLLGGIDFGLIRKNPKIIAGFSDLTALLNVIYEKTGVVTFHTPMVLNFAKATSFTVHSFLNAVNGFDEKNLFAGAKIETLKNGISSGVLKGGNLITITSLIGTPWEINFKGAIVFLEEVDEKLHSADRCLTHLALAKKFKDVRGLVIGNFRGIKTSDVFGILKELMRVDFPVVHTPNIGHVRDKISLPVGAKVRLDTYKKELTILQRF